MKNKFAFIVILYGQYSIRTNLMVEFWILKQGRAYVHLTIDAFDFGLMIQNLSEWILMVIHCSSYNFTALVSLKGRKRKHFRRE